MPPNLLEARKQCYETNGYRCQYDFYFDKNRNILHCCDKTNFGNFSVAYAMLMNAAGFAYKLREQFEQHFNFRLSPNFRLFVYTLDKSVYEWDNGKLEPLKPLQMQYVYPTYLKKKREKRNRV